MNIVRDRKRMKNDFISEYSLEKKIESYIKKMEEKEIRVVDTSILNGNFLLDYKNLLDEGQKKVLLSTKGQYLVIAGAGSGKTHTIVYRTAWLIENGVDERSILMITFTKKSAFEMKERLEKVLKRDVKITISTFHSFCARLIIKHNIFFGVEKMEILEEKQRDRLLLFLVEKILKKYEREHKNEKELEKIISLLNKNDMKIQKLYEKDDKFLEILKEIKKEYRKYKYEKNLYDFDDLLEIVVKKLKENEKFRNILQEKIKYLVVDEYQDSNKIQRELLKLLSGENGNLMVVGDDFQSIYGFRGADFTNILKFGEDFKEARLIKLEKNYRSCNEIIDYSKKVAKTFKLKYNKNIIGTEEIGGKIEINYFENYQKECIFISEKILQLQKEGKKLKDMAVLHRNHFYIGELIRVLEKYKIPYIDKGDGEDFLNISTLHQSKGLEWDIVFIPLLLEGIFPTGLDSDTLEEEKRLYYVGVSRAKKMLFLSYPAFYYGKTGYYDKKSSFLIDKLS